jgi:glycosyltransferase involved in cell wall biosynthesis
VLFLGRLVPVKNVECVLDAWVNVNREIPDALLEIAGTGDESYVRTLRERAKRLNVAERINFRGFVSGAEKQRLLSSAAMLVLPSYHENFGISAIEALAAGVPVIISPEVQLADFVRHNDVGRVVAGEPTEFAAAILEVMRNERIRSRVRTVGPEILAHTFSPQVIGQSLCKMYEGAIARTAASQSTPIA